MDAVKFLEELERMCRACHDCECCPIGSVDHLICMFSRTINPGIDIEEFVGDVEKVKKWSAEHPVKTRLMDFLEKFPGAPIDKDGVPYMRPVTLGYCDVKECEWCKQYYVSSYICWNLPLEE